MADEKPWWRQWLGRPDGWRPISVLDPQRRTWELIWRPSDIPGPFSPRRPLWSVRFIRREVQHRQDWEVGIRLLKPVIFSRRLVPNTILDQGFHSYREAKAVVAKLADQIEAGMWTPGGPLPKSE